MVANLFYLHDKYLNIIDWMDKRTITTLFIALVFFKPAQQKKEGITSFVYQRALMPTFGTGFWL